MSEHVSAAIDRVIDRTIEDVSGAELNAIDAARLVREKLGEIATKVNELDTVAVQTIGIVYGYVAETNTDRVGSSLAQAHVELSEILAGTTNDHARRGLEKLQTAHQGAKGVKGDIQSMTAAAMAEVEAAGAAYVAALRKIASHQIFTPLIDDSQLETVAAFASGEIESDEIVQYRAVNAPLGEAVDEFRAYQQEI